jgi:hypothetical protein
MAKSKNTPKPFVRPSFMQKALMPSKKSAQKRGSALFGDDVMDDIRDGKEVTLSMPAPDESEDARIAAAADEFDDIQNRDIENSVAEASEPAKVDMTENMNAFQKAVPPVLSEIFSPSGNPRAKEKFLISSLSLDQWSLGAIRELTIAGHETVRRIADYHRSELAKAEEILAMGIPGMPRKQSSRRVTSKGTFRNPHNPDQVWYGSGRPPNWIAEARARGFDIEKWRVQN